jgi:hypothetical protein
VPIKTSKKKLATVLPSIPKELIDRMVSGPMDAEAVNAVPMAFKKALIERILGAELSHQQPFAMSLIVNEFSRKKSRWHVPNGVIENSP